MILTPEQFDGSQRDVIVNGDCLEVMRVISDKSVDMILCDLPYGTTACKWDTIIPLEPLWAIYKRIIKDNGAIILTASQPFTTTLISSNMEWFKYCWVWNKKLAGNGVLSQIQPLKIHEDICVFGKGSTIYKPIMKNGKMRKKMNVKISEINNGDGIKKCKQTYNNQYYPESILNFSYAGERSNRFHPTQKPVALFEYLIKTYTNENDLVLDNCLGSGTTAVACKTLNRRFIGIEQELNYCEIADKRQAKIPTGTRQMNLMEV